MDEAEMDIIVDPDGGVRFVYSDALAEVFAGEPMETRRASHVEPFRGGWTADMRPVGGPILFADGGECSLKGQLIWSAHTPFKTRSEALAAEREWLRLELGL